MSLPVNIHGCFGFCPTLSGGDENEAHRCVLFHEVASCADSGEGAAPPDTSEQTRHSGFCMAVVYLGEQFGVCGSTRVAVVRDEEVLCLHSPLPDLWIGVVADRRLEADVEVLHVLLERGFEVFQMRYGAAVVASLMDPQSPAECRESLRSFFFHLLRFLNGCVFPTQQTERWKQQTFPYPTRSWYAVAAFDGLLGYASYHYGGPNDTPKLAMRCGAVVHRQLLRHRDGLGDAASLHYALFDVVQLRLLCASLPPRVLAQLRLHWLLLGADGRVGGQQHECFLQLEEGGAEVEEVPVDILITHVSAATVLVLMRRRRWREGEERIPLARERDRALACAAAISYEVAADLLKPLLPLETLRALPLPAAAAPLASHPCHGDCSGRDSSGCEAAPVFTGKESFWLLWGREGLQGCSLSELSITTARYVARIMHRVQRCSRSDDGEATAEVGDADGNPLDCSITEMLDESGLLEVCRRRRDGAVLAVLVSGLPRLPARFARAAAIKAALGF